MIELSTARLTLRAPTDADIDTMARLGDEESIAAYTTLPSPYERSHAEAFIRDVVPQGWSSGSSLTWGIFRRSDPSALLGVVSLMAIAGGAGDLGYWLGAEHRGHGIMTEAAARVVDFAFAPRPDGLQLRRVGWEALAENKASARVAQKIGLRFEGSRPLAVLHRGERWDQALAGVLDSDDRGRPGEWPGRG